MILKIKRQTVVNGKIVKAGDVIDADILNVRDVKILLSTGKAEIVKPSPALKTADAKPNAEVSKPLPPEETAEANPGVETADAKPKRARKSKAQ